MPKDADPTDEKVGLAPAEVIASLEALTGVTGQKELLDLATAALDRGASLEQKAAALKRNLVIAEAFDAKARQDFATEDGRKRIADKGANENEIKRFFTRVSLVAVMEFLEAIGVSQRDRHRHPITLWRLVRGLAELDDSGNLSPLFHSKLSGRPAPTRCVLAIRSVAAAQLELRFEQQGRKGLNAAASAVAEVMTSIGADAPTASAIKQWRGAVMGRSTNDEGARYYHAALTFLRSQPDSPATQIERTNAALRWLTAIT
jgi:hypothetical protein